MSALTLTLTNAGLSAVANAGTLGPVVIAQVGVGSGSWATAPTASATALLSEIKRLTVDGSSTPSPGLIHINASDVGTDAYSVKEVGLYSSTGVLIAIAGGTANILTKASGSVALVAIDLSVVNVPVGSLTIGDTGFIYPPATETVKGVAEIATTAEVAAGTDDERIVTPAKLSAAFVKKSGDAMTGILTLSGAPTANLHAATKAYVDNAAFVKKSGDTMTGDLNLPGISKTANGYTKLPNGMILQWGVSGNVAGDYSTSVTFPIAFPTACLNVQVAAYQGNAGPDTWANLVAFNATSATLGRGFNGGYNVSLPMYWMAIGY